MKKDKYTTIRYHDTLRGWEVEFYEDGAFTGSYFCYSKADIETVIRYFIEGVNLWLV